MTAKMADASPGGCLRQPDRHGSNEEIPASALQQTVAALAGSCQQNGLGARSWRKKLSRYGSTCWPQGAYYWRQLRYGRAAAIAYAREGADVAINYLPSEEPDASEVVELIRAAGRKAVPIPGDLRDASFCRRLVEDAVRQLGGLDILVSNAGRQQSRSSIAKTSDEDFDATMKTNIYAPFYIIKAALPHLLPGSAIIATASEQAYDPSPDLYDYAQTKAATMNFVKSLAKQLGPKGIRVNGVAPGPIWTPLQISGGASEGKVVTFGATAPLRRAGQPAELAGIYVRLAEDDGSYTTGNIYGAGGGQGQP